ncbi:hypothetical protein [Verrucomicrobium spinosum]|uniref:hypothetical protein n=1 Tax=Verrucomicrobium spinosum TaxID=2736 RepID=UPI0012E2E3F4|nr:hypothetical protein [Verrucomicrobium spinosum]
MIGSLAAGYHYFRKDPSKAVRTKDVDCVLEPFHAAVGAGQSIARQLLDAGWQRRVTGNHQKPGSDKTPVEELPAVRLYPPNVKPDSEEAWFIELLTVPASADVSGRVWTRLPLTEGHFGLPTFRFLSVTTFRPLKAGRLGIRYARPEMMALANLLEHPRIKPESMSAAIVGREIKRSNKDLGGCSPLPGWLTWTTIAHGQRRGEKRCKLVSQRNQGQGGARFMAWKGRFYLALGAGWVW